MRTELPKNHLWIARLRRWTVKGAACLLFLGMAGGTQAADSAVTIEEMMSAIQDRHLQATGGLINWPYNAQGQAASAYPARGFYGQEMANDASAAELVRKVTTELKDPGLYQQFLGNGSGVLLGGKSLPTQVTGIQRLPDASLITEGNYRTFLPQIVGAIRDMKQGYEGQGLVAAPGGSMMMHFTNNSINNEGNPPVEFDLVAAGLRHRHDNYSLALAGGPFAFAGWRHKAFIPPGDPVQNQRQADKVTVDGTMPAISNGYYFVTLSYASHDHGVSNGGGIVQVPFAGAESGGSAKGSITAGFSMSSLVTSTASLAYSDVDLVKSIQVLGMAKGEIKPRNQSFSHNLPDECFTCTQNGCRPGESKSATNCADFSMDLGKAEYGRPAGRLFIHSEKPIPELATPAALQYSISAAGVNVLSDTNGVPRQVKMPQGLADVVTVNAYKYEVRFYDSAHTGSIGGSGFYVPSGSPYQTFTVENPDASPTTYNRFLITKSGGAPSDTREFICNEALGEWTLNIAGGLRRETRSSTWDAAKVNRTEFFTVRNQANQVVSKEQNKYTLFPWGEELVEKTLDPDGAALKTTRSFYSNAATDGGQFGLLKQVVEPYGYWERYEYDSFGRPTKTVAAYQDAPVGAAESASRVVTTIYGSADPAITTVEKIKGTETTRTYTVYRPGETRTIRAQTPGAAWDDANNLVSSAKRYLSGDFAGELQSQKRENGTMTLYAYSLAGNLKTSTVSSGQPNGSETAIVSGSRTVTVSGLSGNLVSETVYDVESNLLLSSASVTQADEFGRPTRIDYNDGTFLTRVYGCCGLDSETDRQGITTTYVRDALKRVISSTRAGITTLTGFDPDGRVLSTIRKGSDNSEITLEANTYDLAGRLLSSVDALSHSTGIVTTVDGSGHRIVTTTLPDGATRVQTYARDGSLLREDGTGVHGRKNLYGVDGLGQFKQEVRLGSQGQETEWTKTWRDMLGRVFKVAQADGATTRSFFNAKGQLSKRIDPDGVATLLAYNDRGELEYTALDMDQDGQISFTGSDRITRTQNTVVSAHGTTVRRSTTSQWTTLNANTTFDASLREVSADGLQAWDTTFGLITHSQVSYGGSGVRTVVITQPDLSTTTEVYQNDRLTSSIDRDAGSAILRSTTLTHDPHGRVATSTDLRNGTTLIAHNNGDQVIGVTTPAPGGGGSAQASSFQYNNRGQRSQTTLPDGGLVNYEFFPTGELKKTFGARTPTTEYTYTGQGQIHTLLAGTGGGGLTRWNYTPARGFLSSKTYADGKSTSYTYTPAGRLLTRAWARGITTTYAHNNAGEVSSVDYSDSTPDVTYTFDRRGRRASTTGALESVAWTFNDAGQPLTETHTSGPLDGVIVTSGYDALLRRSTLTSTAGSSPLTSSGFSYDGASRLASVTSGVYSAEYAYLANSSLLSSLTLKKSGATVLATTRTFDNLDRLTQTTSTPSADTAKSFQYAHNDANQRTRVDQADGSYWVYQYNPQGEVISGKKYFADNSEVAGQQFEYAFDSIGNRTSTTTNGRVASYTANTLNQYTQRAVPGAVDAFGTAASSATVTVNGETANRIADYFSKEVGFDNSSTPVFATIDVFGVKGDVSPNGVVTTETGKVYLPKTPETFVYEDGNLIQDGRWHYGYNAENQLIAAESIASVPVAAKRKVEFVRDYEGRIILKKSYAWNPGTSAYELSTQTKSVYDGTRLIAEMNEGGTLLRSYVWGADLSGTLDGAGGVGGLLMVNTTTFGNHFAAADANGNVTMLVDAATGKTSAIYEYEAFGKTLRLTGSMAKINPFRFSTKPVNPETGLTFYEARVYNADTGRFLSRDRIEEEGGENVYAAFANDPISRVDTLGNDNFQTTGLFGVGNNFVSSVVPAPIPLPPSPSVLRQPAMGYFPEITSINYQGSYGRFGMGANVSPDQVLFNGSSSIPNYGFGASSITNKIWLAPHAVPTQEEILLRFELDVALTIGTAGFGEFIVPALAGAGRATAIANELPCLTAAGTSIAGVKEGALLYRGFGGEARAMGRSWTTVAPDAVFDFRAAAGVYEGNTLDYVIAVRLKSLENVTVRTALPGPTTPSGAVQVPEILFKKPPVPGVDIEIIGGGGWKH